MMSHKNPWRNFFFGVIVGACLWHPFWNTVLAVAKALSDVPSK